MQTLVGLQSTATSSFGAARSGKTVTATILDISGNVVNSGFTIGSVIELSRGYYGVAITFSAPFTGYIKWDNTTDDIILYDVLICAANDSESLRKIETNRWLIFDNQLIIYDDDGTTPLYTWNLFNNNVPDGSSPNERVPV